MGRYGKRADLIAHQDEPFNAETADVPALAGPLSEAAHVGFVGADLCREVKPAECFAGSIPLDARSRVRVRAAAAEDAPAAPRWA